MFSKKKSNAEIVAEDRKLIQNNSDKVGKLVMLTDDESIVAKLKELQEKLKYLMPIGIGTGIETDKKIADKIDDLKVALTQHGDMSFRIDGIISSILLLLVDRN